MSVVQASSMNQTQDQSSNVVDTKAMSPTEVQNVANQYQAHQQDWDQYNQEQQQYAASSSVKTQDSQQSVTSCSSSSDTNNDATQVSSVEAKNVVTKTVTNNDAVSSSQASSVATNDTQSTGNEDSVTTSSTVDPKQDRVATQSASTSEGTQVKSSRQVVSTQQQQQKIARDSQVAQNNASSEPLVNYQGLQEQSFTEDKATYNPGDTVKMNLTLQNNQDFDQFGTYKVNVYNPLTNMMQVGSGSWKTAKNGGMDTINIDWKTPDTDNQGYVVNAQLYTSVGKLLAEYDNAVDVDSNVYNHPRYGALTDYSADTIDKQKAAIDSFAKDYHMNMQMLYDCYYRPQNPCPDQDSWVDWHGDTISKNAIEADINQIHNDGSKAFLYDMINAYTGEEGDQDADLGPIDVKTVKNGNDVQNSGPTGIFYPSNSDQKGQQFHCVIGNNPDTDIQWYNDPANAQWQNYIIPKIMDAMQRMGFDGWQGDTNGQMIGNTYANRGTDKTINDADFYYYFVQAAQKAFNGKYAFGLNAVNNVGQDAIATKSDPTFDYTELWPSSFKTYNDIGNVIEDNWKNDGKPLIVPAYLYDQWRNDAAGGKGDALPKTYNDNVVRQLAATIMAHGGSPMILSDGGYLLDDEYYPWPRFQNGKSINMDNNLGNPNTGYMRHYFDFDTAYENILQDSALKANNNYIQVWTGNGVGQGNWVNRSDGEANTVYAFSKSKDGLDTLNMVNLMGSTNQWQVYNSNDNNQHNVQPQKNLWVKFYPSEQTKDIKHIYMSSPDSSYQGKRVELPFKEYTDQDGHKYVEFEVPNLEVWDLIYMTSDDLNPLSKSGANTNTPASTTNNSGSTTSQPMTRPTQPSTGSTTEIKPSTNTGSTDINNPVSGSTSATDSKQPVSNSQSSSTSSNDKPSSTVNKPASDSSSTASNNDKPISNSSNNVKPSTGINSTTDSSKPSDTTSSSKPVAGSTTSKPSSSSVNNNHSVSDKPVINTGATVDNKPVDSNKPVSSKPSDDVTNKPSDNSQSGTTSSTSTANNHADTTDNDKQFASQPTVETKPADTDSNKQVANNNQSVDNSSSSNQVVNDKQTDTTDTGDTTMTQPVTSQEPVVSDQSNDVATKTDSQGQSDNDNQLKDVNATSNDTGLTKQETPLNVNRESKMRPLAVNSSKQDANVVSHEVVNSKTSSTSVDTGVHQLDTLLGSSTAIQHHVDDSIQVDLPQTGDAVDDLLVQINGVALILAAWLLQDWRYDE